MPNQLVYENRARFNTPTTTIDVPPGTLSCVLADDYYRKSLGRRGQREIDHSRESMNLGGT